MCFILDAFGKIIEIMFRQEIITQEAVEKWSETNIDKISDIVKKDITTFLEVANEDDDDSDSD